MAVIAGKVKYEIAGVAVGHVHTVDPPEESVEVFDVIDSDSTTVLKLTDGIVNLGEITITGNLDPSVHIDTDGSCKLVDVGDSIDSAFVLSNGDKKPISGIVQSWKVESLGLGQAAQWRLVIARTGTQAAGGGGGGGS